LLPPPSSPRTIGTSTPLARLSSSSSSRLGEATASA
jgi:hypothetical protein